MRTERVAVVIAGFLIATTCSLCADEAPVVSRPVGVVRISVPENAKSLVSIPFKPFDSAVGSVLSGQLTGASSETDADTVIKWNPSALRYELAMKSADGRWLSDFHKMISSEMTLCPGEGFFIWNRQSATQDVFLAGEVVLDESNSVVLLPSLNLIGSPYSASLTNSTLPGAGSNTLLMAKGYWYENMSTGTCMWVEVRPYASAFPPEGTFPAITGIRIENGRKAVLTIECGASRKLDIYYKDFSPTGSLETTGGWLMAEEEISVNGRKTLEWADTFAKSESNDQQSSIPFARYYLVGNAGIVSSNGVPLSRSRFVFGGNAVSGSLTLRSDAESATVPNANGSSANPLTATHPADPSCGIGKIIYVDINSGADHLTGRSTIVAGSDGPKKTINAGLNIAGTGDTVIIAPGVYREKVEVPDGVKVIAVGRVEVN